MDEARFQAGVIGLRMGNSHCQGYNAHPHCKLVAICDTDQAILQQRQREYAPVAAYSDFRDLMTLTREMFTEVVDAVCGTRLVPFKEQVIDFDGWQEFTLRDAIRHFWTAPGPRPS